MRKDICTHTKEGYHESVKNDVLCYDNKLCNISAGEYSRLAIPKGIDTIVVKVGTNVISQEKDARMVYNMKCIAEDLININDPNKRGYKTLLISSGAIGLGKKERERIGDKRLKDPIKDKQRDAVVGQPLLYRLWQSHFLPQQKIEELLLTHQDVEHYRTSKKFARLENYIRKGISPEINEDDKYSLEEIQDKNRMFRDNDELASLIATYLKSDGYNPMLIILTNLEGLFTKKSFENKKYNDEIKKCLRLWPQDNDTEGFFIAKIRKL